MKKIKNFLIFFILFLLSGFIYKYENIYYDNLIKPFFTLPNFMFSILWIIVYIINTITIVKVLDKTSILKNKDYFYTLLSNYASIYTYLIMFFNLKSPIFGFVLSILVLINSILLFKETRMLIKKQAFLLFPYIIYIIYLCILSGSVFFMNF